VVDFSAPATEVFQILRSYDYEVLLYDEESNRVDDPADARRMFARPENLLVSIIDAGEDSSVRLMVGKSTKITDILGLVTALRNCATKFNLLFNVRQYGKEISPKDFASGSAVAESFQKDTSMNIFESGLYGTSRSSYLRLENARMIVRHSAKIDETKIGARGRHIDQIFVENAVGERFLFPTTNIAPARAMTQHVNMGGTFADVVGQQIQRMATDYANLANCSQYIYQNAAAITECDRAMTVREACRCEMRKLRKTFERLCRPTAYQAEADAIAERANTLIEGQEQDDAVSPEHLAEMREIIAVEGRELADAVIEAACKAVRRLAKEAEANAIEEDFLKVVPRRPAHPDKAPEEVEAEATPGKTANGRLFARPDAPQKPFGRKQVEPGPAEVEEAREDLSTPTVSVLGRKVNADAWEAFKNGHLDLYEPPHPKEGVQFTDKTSELLYKLGAIVPQVKDDTMLNLLSFVADRMSEERDPAMVRRMRAVAMQAIRIAGLSLSEGIAEKNHVIREFSSWLRGLTTEAAVGADPQEPLDTADDLDDTEEALDDAEAGTNAMEEGMELSREDVLLPRPNQGDNLAREVTKPTVTEPTDGEEVLPDEGYISRLRTLAGLRNRTA